MSFDRNDPTQLAELKAEVDTDPTGRGYVWANTTEGLALINEKQDGVISVQKPRISPAAVRSSTTYDAYNTLAIDEQEWLRWITGSNGVQEENLLVTADLRKQLYGDGTPTDSMWAVAQRDAMVAAMDALINVAGSRAEQLFGFGTTISRDDWIAARDS